MEIHNAMNLDGAILYGIINEKLRLECDSLEKLMTRMELDETKLQEKLDEMGCYYDPVVNQLRQK
ncbi:DUF4250 domain-containing protein [Veronia nyctiphanis]|uniref:DUF4250 domain-containing protein n=1 Tax=Veronia nyctiphanis TaxID=1278244 RepID=A0A4V1LTF1_9GAMM|nr:DUF4250 domain-containing protein [Veronia nyctiphanis]RXJ74978.1 DUF4250 domain-containing protein [Veronia nyctiphanis]